MKKRIKRFEKKKNYISKLLNSRLFESNRNISQDDSLGHYDTSVGISSSHIKSYERSKNRLTLDAASVGRTYNA